MRILFAAALALVASLATASAQPLTCHLEATIGAGVSIAKIKDDVTGEKIALASNGLLIAPGAGCDVHFGDTLIGAFGRYDFGTVKSSITLMGDTLTAEMKQTWLVAARAGMRVNPATIAYGFLGYSGMKLDLGAGSTELTKDLNGLAVGGGLEWMMGGPFAMKLEYTYTHLNTEGLGGNIELNPSRHDVRLGATYRFLSPN